MNRGLLTRIKERLQRSLDTASISGSLTGSEVETIVALFESLTREPSFARARVVAYIEQRIRDHAGYFREYEAAASLLDERTTDLRRGHRFRDLDLDARDEVLRSLLPTYPHPFNEPAWKQRAHVVSDNIELFLVGSRIRRFRTYVVRDLTTYFFQSAEGWAVVGYRDYPGHVRSESEPCEVRKVIEDGDELMLELSDGCIERLNPAALELDPVRELAIRTKYGRQRATFSRSAYLTFCSYLEDSEAGFVLRVGAKRYEVLR